MSFLVDSEENNSWILSAMEIHFLCCVAMLFFFLFYHMASHLGII